MSTLTKMFVFAELKGRALRNKQQQSIDKEELKKIFDLLRDKKIPYLTIGGIAALLYDVETITFDLDLLLPSDYEILTNLIAILKELNYCSVLSPESDEYLMPVEELTPKEIMEKVSVRVKNNYRIDILTVPKKQFYTFFGRRQEVSYENTVVLLVHIDDLITLLRKRNTEKDRIVIKMLGKVKGKV